MSILLLITMLIAIAGIVAVLLTRSLLFFFGALGGIIICFFIAALVKISGQIRRREVLSAKLIFIVAAVLSATTAIIYFLLELFSTLGHGRLPETSSIGWLLLLIFTVTPVGALLIYRQYQKALPHKYTPAKVRIFAKLKSNKSIASSPANRETLQQARENSRQLKKIKTAALAVLSLIIILTGLLSTRLAMIYIWRSGNVRLIRILLAFGADPNKKIEDRTLHPLQSAVFQKNTELVKLLLEKGADINFHDILFYANYYDTNTEMVKLLLEAGTDVNDIDSKGWTPLMYAVQYNKQQIIRYLLPKDKLMAAKTKNILLQALESSDKNKIDGILENEAQRNRKINWLKKIDLKTVYQDHSIDDLRLFLQTRPDAEIDRKDSFAKTVLMLACQDGDSEAVSLLLAYGADSNISNSAGFTPLMFAAEQGRIKIVAMLLKSGANPQAKDCNGRTTLFFASAGGNPEVVSALLARGVDINLRNQEGETALNIARKKNYPEIVKLLETNVYKSKK